MSRGGAHLKQNAELRHVFLSVFSVTPKTEKRKGKQLSFSRVLALVLFGGQCEGNNGGERDVSYVGRIYALFNVVFFICGPLSRIECIIYLHGAMPLPFSFSICQ